MSESTFDYIVVGLGSAGAVLSAKLSDKGHRVLAIDAGGSDIQPQILLPAGMMKMPKKNYWMYQTEPDLTRNGRRDLWASGKVLGGGSAVNAMLWVRGHRDDFDEWAELGADGWDYEALLPLMREIETSTDFHGPLRGTSGPQYVSRVRLDHAVAAKFVAGAQQTGYPYNDDYNADESLGVAWSQLSQRNGLRQTSARAFLHPAARRNKNLTILKNATVLKVITEGDRATGIEYRRLGVVERAHVNREVILSAGAVGTPALLLRSGIGAPEAVRSLGVPLVADVPGVGRNLQEHTSIRLQYQVTQRTLNQEATPLGMVRGAYQFVVHRRGPAVAPLANAVLFGRLDGATRGRPDYQVMFAPLSLALRPDGSTGKQNVRLSKASVVSALLSLLHPRARGTVTVTSTDPDVLPIIDLQYLAVRQDVTDTIASCRQVRRIFTDGGPMSSIVKDEDYPGTEVQTDDDWRAFLADKIQNCAHWAGTARMGSLNDAEVVVDAELRVRGMKGMRVADASVMPTLPSGNTNAPALLIGAKAADLVLGERD
ncbi:GMC family oxidoreductase N-terminal domain-containing protein [Nocardia sp. R6R-6]|uniref:GMC family oxidoreductase N-terminal domain-containing protein n=1 Tax=Nocardia sp. R6R-6 TaxID=3459303 RepID=UPI00403E0920